MSRSRINRDRIAIVVLLLAAAAWFTATRCGAWVFTFDLYWTGHALTPQSSPRGYHFDLMSLPTAILVGKILTLGRVLTALGSVLALALLASGVAAWRLRRPLSRRVTRLPVRLGLLALLLGVTADARSLANAHAVYGWLGYEHMFGTDCPAGFAGESGLLASGTLLALGGIALTAGLALVSARLARRLRVLEWFVDGREEGTPPR